MDKILVTGASRGLGLAISRKLAASGYGVIGISRRSTPEFEAASEAVRTEGVGFLQHVGFDLAEIEAIPALVTRVREEHGAIYGLVNNAAASAEGLLATMRNSQIEELVRLNTVSPLILTKYVVRGMMSDGRGRIVNISSIVASTGFRALSVYAATKSSLIGFTKSLAREVGRVGVTVNAVAPGFMRTAMTTSLDDKFTEQVIRRSPLGRLADVDDVAEAVAYLMSEKARNVTGAVFTIDAGGTA
jgi:3-oxoacyl-[acyl-carrier protein] reductase